MSHLIRATGEPAEVVRHPTVQLTKLLFGSLDFCVVGFCRSIKGPLADPGHDAQTVRLVVAGQGVFQDPVTLVPGQLQRNLLPDRDSLPILHWPFTAITSPFQLPRYGERECGRPDVAISDLVTPTVSA